MISIAERVKSRSGSTMLQELPSEWVDKLREFNASAKRFKRAPKPRMPYTAMLAGHPVPNEVAEYHQARLDEQADRYDLDVLRIQDNHEGEIAVIRQSYELRIQEIQEAYEAQLKQTKDECLLEQLDFMQKQLLDMKLQMSRILERLSE